MIQQFFAQNRAQAPTGQGKFAVALYTQNPGKIVLIDAATAAILTAINNPNGTNTYAYRIASDISNGVVCADCFTPSFGMRIDAKNNAYLSTVALTSPMRGRASDNNGRIFFSPNNNGANGIIINTATGGTTPVVMSQAAGHVACGSNRFCVGYNGLLINATTGVQVATLGAGVDSGVAANDAGTEFCLATGSTNLRFLDAVNATTIGNLAISFIYNDQDHNIEAGSGLYCYASSATTVSFIDQAAKTFLGNVTVGATPQWICYGNGKFAVANTAAPSVSIISAATRTVLQTVAVASAPTRIAYGGGKFAVLCPTANVVTIIDANTYATQNTVSLGTSAFYDICYV